MLFKYEYSVGVFQKMLDILYSWMKYFISFNLNTLDAERENIELPIRTSRLISG